jgi:hypothetical protein
MCPLAHNQKAAVKMADHNGWAFTLASPDALRRHGWLERVEGRVPPRGESRGAAGGAAIRSVSKGAAGGPAAWVTARAYARVCRDEARGPARSLAG